MEQYTEKIKKFSRVIYILLQIVFVALIVTGALEMVALIVHLGQIPALFKIGSITVVVPSFIVDGITINGSTFNFGVVELVRTIIMLVIVITAKSILRKLQVDGSPFRAGIVVGLKMLSITLLVAAALTGLYSFVAAGVVWVLCMIFDYGCALQNENDTTL